jgi:hypothetical protein
VSAPGADSVPRWEPAQRLLLASSTSGLCNRLLNLVGGMRIAQETGRRLVLHWPKNAELGAAFEDLYEDAIPQLDAATLYDLLHTESRVTVYQTERGGRVNRAHYRSVVAKDDAHVIVLKGWGLPAMRWEGHETPKVKAIPYLRALTPRAAIRERIERHAPPPGCIGIHIRRGDAAAYFAASRDADYLTILRAVLAAQPSTRFFLCTDDAGAEAAIREAFGERVLAQPKDRRGMDARGSLDGMQAAVADLVLLSRTRAILGNHRSTFSTTAALLGPRRLVVANARNAGRGLKRAVCDLLA